MDVAKLGTPVLAPAAWFGHSSDSDKLIISLFTNIMNIKILVWKTNRIIIYGSPCFCKFFSVVETNRIITRLREGREKHIRVSKIWNRGQFLPNRGYSRSWTPVWDSSVPPSTWWLIIFSHWRQICTQNLHVWGNVVSSQCVSPSRMRHFCSVILRQVYYDVMALPRGWRYQRQRCHGIVICTNETTLTFGFLL